MTNGTAVIEPRVYTGGLKDTEVRVGVTGTLFSAPVGTTLPADAIVALDPAFLNLGYLSDEDPVAVDTQRESQDIFVWQASDPVRSLVSKSGNTFAFKLRQRNILTLQLAFGGTVTTTTGKSIYVPGSTPTERALILEVVDGTVHDRWVMPKGKCTAVGTMTISKSKSTDLDVTITPQIDSAFGAAWKLFTDDPAVVFP